VHDRRIVILWTDRIQYLALAPILRCNVGDLAAN